jgi:ribosomal protein L11 methyltransferase
MPDTAATRYLEIRSSFAARPRVVQRLGELGCRALEEKPNGWVLAYTATNRELERFAEALRSELGAEIVHEVSLDPNWALAFADSLEAIALTPTLWVAPVGKTERVPLRSRCILLEPAFAFGFGEHPTTRLIAGWLERAVAAHTHAKVLDFGCGTGILAVAALFFGASEAYGLDIDPDAVAAARRNAALNALDAKCGFSCDPLSAEARTFDVVVANVDAATLSEHALALATRMSVGASLALTGFLRDDVERVSLALDRAGVRVREIAADGDWVLLANWPAAG